MPEHEREDIMFLPDDEHQVADKHLSEAEVQHRFKLIRNVLLFVLVASGIWYIWLHGLP